jgi:hypothetical protein
MFLHRCGDGWKARELLENCIRNGTIKVWMRQPGTTEAEVLVTPSHFAAGFRVHVELQNDEWEVSVMALFGLGVHPKPWPTTLVGVEEALKPIPRGGRPPFSPEAMQAAAEVYLHLEGDSTKSVEDLFHALEDILSRCPKRSTGLKILGQFYRTEKGRVVRR